MSRYGTPFVESEAILAALAHDLTEMERIAEEMTHAERGLLIAACGELCGVLRAMTRIQHHRDDVS